MAKKAQLFSIDAALALVMFTIMLIFLLVIWNLYSGRLQDAVEQEEIELVAFQTIDILTKSWGVPNNWDRNPAAANVTGLKLNPGSLDKSKVETFFGMDYNLIKKKFNMERFDFNFTLKDQYGAINRSKGLPVDPKSARTIAVSDVVVIGNETKQVIFTIWRKT